jgi:creatinine amidohydrolase
LNGVTGTPSRATVAEGERLFGWIVTDLSKTIRRALRENAPLTTPYFTNGPNPATR